MNDLARGPTGSGAAMNGEAIMTVSAAVVTLTQLLKWAGVPARWGPLLVLALSALGVAVWVYTQGQIGRADAFSYFAGWIAVATSAAGVYGFTRAAGDGLTELAHGAPQPPPPATRRTPGQAAAPRPPSRPRTTRPAADPASRRPSARANAQAPRKQR